ncbi:MAG: hypothetical protein GXP13_05470, partial [Gammaproteobacteria bacterium]|nr:hypothetical protein [Gammaproteobacteria bacterium]
MSMDSTIDYSTLNWVKEEIDDTLKQARNALEEYVDNQDDATQLRFCLTYVHQVYGTLQMVELYGASLFAEEMESLLEALLANEVTQKEDAYEVLMRAILQLPEYLERIQRGMKDNPLVLMPIMNDLRTARGSILLSESALFSPNLDQIEAIDIEAPTDLFGIDPKTLARKLRPLYQIGLLGWYRDNETEGSLKKLVKVLTQLEQVCSRNEIVRLWWVAKGVVESLIKNGVRENITLKLLLGQVDREIKRLIDLGEQEISNNPAEVLLKNLLYYIAQSDPVTPRIKEIKQKYNLSSALLSDKEVESDRESMASPNAELLETVSVAISEDLSRVKDALDILLRSDERDNSTLGPQVEVLNKMADTLGMLGMGVPRKVIQEQSVILQSILSGELESNEARLMETAGALLFVESSLIGLVESSHAEEQMQEEISSDTGDSMLANAEMRQIHETVLKEIQVEIAKSKDAMVAFIDAPMDFEQLKLVPSYFNSAKGGMLIMGLAEAAGLIDAARAYIADDILRDRIEPSQQNFEYIADVISSIEYYLEALRENRANAKAILDVAYESMNALGHNIEKGKREERQEEPVTKEDSNHPATAEFAIDTEALSAAEMGEQDSPEEPEDVIEQSESSEAEVQAETSKEAEPVAESSGSGRELPDDIDEDIIDIFIEEAEEVLEEIQDNLPRWKENYDDQDSLANIRRSFHTLKGSGRLVGALSIGEFSWAIEGMLNKVINGALQPSLSIVSILDDSVSALPALISELKGEGPANIDTQSFADRVENEINGNKDEAKEAEEILIAEAEQSVDQEPPSQVEIIRVMDPVLFDIFNKESAGHIESINEYINTAAEREESFVTEDLTRALHTLHGSARMAGADDIAEVAGAYEKYAKILHENESVVNEESCSFLSELVNVITEMLGLINKSGDPELDADGLVEKINALHAVEESKQEERLRTEQNEANRISEQTPGTADQSSADEDEDDYDQEIIEVFLEEGTELLDSSEIILQKLIDNPADEEAIIELQRELHTLKGGALMSGIAEIGDLSHAVESVLTAVVEDGLQVSGNMIDVMHQSVDRLIRLLEGTKNKQSLEMPNDLIADLKMLLEVDVDQPEEVEEIEVIPDTDTSLVEDSAEIINFPVAEERLVEEIEVEEPESTDKGKRKKPYIELEPPLVIPPPIPAPVQVSKEAAAQTTGGEMVRVRSDLLDNLVNYAGEVSIYRSRMEQQINAFGYNLVEMDQTVHRLREQLRKLEIETEAQVLFRYEQEMENNEKFDPLEMDRYSTMQQLSRALMETTADIGSIQGLLDGLVRESETLMIQQARVNTDLQEGLMRTRMVSFSGLIPRLQRIMRQTCKELNKKANLKVVGEGGELDRNVLERITAPLEHMLRNSMAHGIESPKDRKTAGKSDSGTITLSVAREGSEIVLTLDDDGAGMDLDAIRAKAKERGLLEENSKLSDNDIMQFVLESGFSTADEVTQLSGRGVGMDVVNSEIKQLGGSLNISSETGKGARFVIRLPLTLAMNHALLVKVADETYAIPLTSVEGIVRMTYKELENYNNDPDSVYSYADSTYDVRSLGKILHANYSGFVESEGVSPVLLVRSGDHKMALQVDALLGSREVVVKSVGPQLSTLRGVSGATILGDGRVVLILDMSSIIRLSAAMRLTETVVAIDDKVDSKINVMVVDDSITVRKVTTRLLERNDMNVITAKDG